MTLDAGGTPLTPQTPTIQDAPLKVPTPPRLKKIKARVSKAKANPGERKEKVRNREGSITKTASGRFRWRVQLSGHWYTGTTEELEDAENHIKTCVLAHSDDTLVAPSRVTVRSWAAEWLQLKAARRSPATIDSYNRILKNHILPEIGDIPLQKLRGNHLLRMYANLAQKHAVVSKAKRPEDRSPKSHPRRAKAALARAATPTTPPRKLSNATMKLIHTVLHGLLEGAVKGELIAQNVANKVQPEMSPEGRPKKKEYYRPDEAAKLFPVLMKRPQGLIFEVYIALGPRRAEPCGFTWDGLDFDRGLVHLSQGVKLVEGRPVLGTLKTEQSRRTLTVAPGLLSRLHEHRLRQEEWRRAAGADWKETGLIFTTRTGGMLNPDNLRITFANLCDEAGVRTLSIQALRRTFTNLRRRKGDPLVVIAGDLGHTRLSTLLNDYVIVDVDERGQYARDLDELI